MDSPQKSAHSHAVTDEPGASLLERESPLAVLEHRWGLSASTRGQIAVISGEAGAGKTAFLDCVARRKATDRLFAWGHCDALVTPRQLGPFFDLAPVLGTSVTRMLLEGGAAVGLFPAVLEAISALPPGSVLVFEDLHWADHASMDLLTFISRRIGPLRVMIVLTYRDDEVHGDHPMTRLLGSLPPSSTTRIHLEPLSAAAVDAIARRHGRDGGDLYRATAGNPFFLSEIVAQPNGSGGQPPRSIKDAVLTRLSRIAPEERAVLDVLSVAPDPMSDRVILRLFGPEGAAHCRACETRGLLVRTSDDRTRFRHELARIVTLGALPPAEARLHHRRLLDIYQSMGEEVPADLLVHHAASINDVGMLLAVAPAAAAKAASLGAHKEAAAQLAIALRHVEAAPAEQAAQLYQDWAYETGLFDIADDVLDARREAVRRWRSLGRMDRVGDNLRWLWRLHWYRGEADQAEAAASESLAVLEALPAGAELAQAYALRSHLHLLKGERAQSIEWGRKALGITPGDDEIDTRVQTMVTVASALLFEGRDEGRRLMDEGLALALSHGFHEHAARAYTNYSEYAIVVRDWTLAERLVREGLSFDIQYGLDAWTGYLSGRHAQLRLERGQLEQAETLARGVLDIEGRTVLMRLPALTTLAIVRSRRGADDAQSSLDAVLDAALSMREQQRITPVRLALIDHLYVRGRLDEARAQIDEMLAFGTAVLRPWDAAALRVWAKRLDHVLPDSVGERPNDAQALELNGDLTGAAARFDHLQAPYEAAMCRLVALQRGQSGKPKSVHDAFTALGCEAAAQAVRRIAKQRGQVVPLTKARRGPYQAARSHPLGLTAKEVQVLALMADGASNAEIAKRVSRSSRTVEHHVSAVLQKLNASNRLQASLRALAEPWIVRS